MGVRKNARFLSAAERENFVKACVLMKADIVNPSAPSANQYSRWDESVAIHRMIQNANSPTHSNVNFGHGGSGAYSFLSWHRYFLYRFELQLQSYVPGVMLPYWDWSDPTPIMTETFLGPDGDSGTHIVSSGYFAPNAPGTTGNPTTRPGWWPATLTGWNLHTAFGTLAGPLKRFIGALSGLPSATDLQTLLAQTTYPPFQNMLESGNGLASGNQMHNGLHGWVGGTGGHMTSLTGSPFDPFFYLHHCNIDRLWAMWQMDGHANEYPLTGGNPEHDRNDIMYPWTGGTSGYSSNLSFAPIVMPSFASLGAKHNGDTLDHRAFGYTYDTLAIVGLGLDRTGSMMQLTPDPMTTGAPDVTKWQAATRGVSAFLQDCETVQQSGAIYVMAGIKTFRSLAADDFQAVFSGTPYGLIKTGGAYSKAVFDSAVAAMTPGGGTPLADALLDVESTLVAPPYGWIPSDEQRYLAMLTDGMLTTGAPMSSIPDGSLAGTAVFAMGFGTGADVDYTTLASMVAKGRTLATPQVFHGENAGTIDKFYSNALAAAIGFTTLFDPVLELFAGEHVHLDFDVTSAEDALLLTVQGMDFVDENWRYHLFTPDGEMVYSSTPGVMAGMPAMPGMQHPHVTARRGDGRLTLVVQRDHADDPAWVGRWRLMASYRAREMDAMVMIDIGELMYPVGGGPVRGARYARLLEKPAARIPSRSVIAPARHALDVRPSSTNLRGPACSVVITIQARSRIQIALAPRTGPIAHDKTVSLETVTTVLAGSVSQTRAFARIVGPARDLHEVVAKLAPKQVPRAAALKNAGERSFDAAVVLAHLERKDPKLAARLDAALPVHGRDAALSVDAERATVPGAYDVGFYVEGRYCPVHGNAQPMRPPGGRKAMAMPGSRDACGPDCAFEHFSRLLSSSFAVAPRPAKVPTPKKQAKRKR